MIKQYSIAIDFGDNDFFTKIYSVLESLFKLIESVNYDSNEKEIIESLERLTGDKEFLKSQISSLFVFTGKLFEYSEADRDYFEKTLRQVLVNEEIPAFVEREVKNTSGEPFWYNLELYILDIYVIPDDRFGDKYSCQLFHKITLM